MGAHHGGPGRRVRAAPPAQRRRPRAARPRPVARAPRRTRRPGERAVGLQPELPLGFVHTGRGLDSLVRQGSVACRAGSSTTSCCTSLAHLLQPGHGPEFWALLQGYPVSSGPAATSRASRPPPASTSATSEPDHAPRLTAYDRVCRDAGPRHGRRVSGGAASGRRPRGGAGPPACPPGGRPPATTGRRSTRC